MIQTNKMKKPFAFMLAGALLLVASCDDFLTITPTSSIVEEEFWEDKNDLDNVVNACYARLIKEDMMNKYIQWGELRSDNFEKMTGVSNTNVANVMNANLLSTNSMFSWTCMYNAINYCNKVLAHGPEIVEKDESFSEGEWLPIRAEMITLRALCHFYLVRTFGEIPYVTKDYNNDSQDFLLPQSSQIEVLDSIIIDLESVKSTAMNSYGNTVDDKGKITKKAVYALLADVYLWRASLKDGDPTLGGTTAAEDYQNCVDCCDWVINEMEEDYKEELNTSGNNLEVVDGITLEDLFIQNVESSGSSGYVESGMSSYDYIFGEGNSRESIFELQIDGTQNTNSMITNMFYNPKEGKASLLVCSNSLLSSVDANPNTEIPNMMFTKTDYRRWEIGLYTGSEQTDYPLGKYTFRYFVQWNGTSYFSGMKDNSATTYNSSMSIFNPNTSNWIVYRLSDMVLMKAEALSQLSADENTLKTAFNLVREVFRRSNPFAYLNRPAETDSLNFASFNTQSALENLVMAERQREFVGEGKRWFDLVRYAQRHGSTSGMLKMLTRKYGDNKKAIEAKLASLKSLFAPIYNDELKNNSLLHQNEVWGTTESTSKTDEL